MIILKWQLFNLENKWSKRKQLLKVNLNPSQSLLLVLRANRRNQNRNMK
jgi:hypothetical protein